jgi:DNA-binding NarL/FixJ family response regulator
MATPGGWLRGVGSTLEVEVKFKSRGFFLEEAGSTSHGAKELLEEAASRSTARARTHQSRAFGVRPPTRAFGAAARPRRLSVRELDVLRALADGHSNKVIARQLGRSPHTVKRHVANIFDKLNVSTRAQAAVRFQPIARRDQ